MRIAALVFILVVACGLVVWFADDRVPARVDRYLAYCPQHAAACERKISEVRLAMAADYVRGLQFCPPADTDRAAEERGVRHWLAARADLSVAPAAEGIRDALIAIDTCR